MTHFHRSCISVQAPFALCFTLAASAVAQPTSAGSSQLTATLQGDSIDTALNDEAARAFWEGKRYYDQGDFERARERFEHTYRLTSDAELLYNIGQTYRQQGKCESALNSYLSFLEAAPESRHVELAKRHIESLQTTCPAPPQPKPKGRGSRPTPTTVPVRSAIPNDEGSPTTARSPTNQAAARDITPKTVPVVETGSHHKAAVSTKQWVAISTLVVGTLGAGTAIGIGIWNESRYETWSKRDRELSKGLAANQTAALWAQQQGDNDRLIQNISQVDHLTRYLGIGAGLSLLASAALHFAFPETPRRVGATRLPQPTVNCTATPETNSTLVISYQTAF